MKIAFQADADLDPDIGRGLRRGEPQVLRMAADSGRVLVTGDLATMQVHFREFVARHDSPGVLLVPSSRSIGEVIDGLLFVWQTWSPDDLRNQIWWLP